VYGSFGNNTTVPTFFMTADNIINYKLIAKLISCDFGIDFTDICGWIVFALKIGYNIYCK
jgi:hypothetical protein